jgi:hypothetical protein
MIIIRSRNSTEISKVGISIDIISTNPWYIISSCIQSTLTRNGICRTFILDQFLLWGIILWTRMMDIRLLFIFTLNYILWSIIHELCFKILAWTRIIFYLVLYFSVSFSDWEGCRLRSVYCLRLILIRSWMIFFLLYFHLLLCFPHCTKEYFLFLLRVVWTRT